MPKGADQAAVDADKPGAVEKQADAKKPEKAIPGTPLAGRQARTAYDDDVDVARWKSGTDGVRATATWAIKTIGAIAAVVFGAGPLITRGELSGAYLPQRIILIVVFAAVGASGLIAVIVFAAQVLVPRRVSLRSLPLSLLGDIAEDPSSYLPHTARDMDSFRKQRKAWLRAAAENDADIKRLGYESEEIEREIVDCKERIAATAEADHEDRTKLRAELAKREGQLHDNHRELNTYRSAPYIRANADVYERTKEVLLAQAEYETTRSVFAENTWKLPVGKTRIPRAAVAALVGLIGAVGYVAVWSYKPTEPKAASAPGPSGRLAKLGKVATPTGQALWDAAGLSECVDSGVTTIDVLVRSGSGVVASPYVVEPLPTPLCPSPRVVFDVINASGQLAFYEPEKLTIQYTTETTVVPTPDSTTSSS